jgi:hypothetical protein
MSGDQDEIGSVADEAARLLGALSEWARDAAQDVDRHLATGADECTYCPVCRTVHALRGLSPEVRTQLASAGTTFLRAGTRLLAQAMTEQRNRSGGVEHIDLDEDPGDDGDWPEDTDREEGDR